MITEHTHSENNDWQEPGGEQPSASENMTPQPVLDALAHEAGQTTGASIPSDELPSPVEAEEVAVTQETQGSETEKEKPVESATGDEAAQAQAAPEQVEQETAAVVSPASSASLEEVAVVEEAATLAAEPANPAVLENETSLLFPLNVEIEMPLAQEEGVRPFMDFIEEFRQTEGHFGSLLNTSESSFTDFVAGSESVQEPVTFLEIAPEDLAQVVDLAVPVEPLVSEAEAVATPAESDEAPSVLTQPRLSPERPVSPLLRPATRPRVPRHSRHRIDELIHPAELRGDLPKMPAPVEEPVNAAEVAAPAPVVEEAKPEEPSARPARRYRFDRPATTASATPLTTRTPAPARGTEKRGFGTPAEPVAPVAEPTPAHPGASISPVIEPPAARPSVPEPVSAPAPGEPPVAPAPAPTPTPTRSTTERRRRSNHERAREKEQPVVVPTPEPIAPIVEPPVPVSAEEIPVEDLPPLEYADLQAASSRRRRRRRAGTASTLAVAPSANGVSPSSAALPDLVVPPAPLPAPAQPKSVPALSPSYNIVSGYTVSQMNQGNDVSGPFMGPEPSPARGSTFSTPTPVRHVRSEAARNAPAARHAESPVISNASVNHMANVVSQAIQTQTDRMVAELRRANQVPTNVSVSLPPFPSTERVGVFVDVANLLYSARTLRITVDFGKLLDFLRGNRRLVRAQAYCPTSPQPGDDQMFLQAVKGLGYRITTKNYKIFSSGAKKADLDLDLCMDVVRLVDGKAVDCIVLVSGDSDFMPMLDYCSDHGVRVEVAAFDESMSATLRQSCDLFVNLSMLEEIRS